MQRTDKEFECMKKIIRWAITIIVVCIVSIALDFVSDGVPLLGVPDIKNIEKVLIKHGDYPDEIKEYSDEKNIELAVGLLGYLRYSPLKSLSDDNQLIQIIYIMDDGTRRVVSANNYTVWWNGKPSALKDEYSFVKMCTAIFFSQNDFLRC